MLKNVTDKAKFYFDRVTHLRAGNLVEFAKQSRPITRKPVPVIIADMLWCSVRHELGFRDYAMWEFASLNGRERKTWMTHPKSHLINERYNSPEKRTLFSNKVEFYQEFNDLLGREWIDAREVTDEQFAEFMNRHPNVVIKPADGHGGAGVERHTFAPNEDPAAARRRLISAGQELVEETITQHPAMASLHGPSVNTVRIIGFERKDGSFRVLAAVLRIGNGAAVDNFASGGMYTMLDKDGVALYPGVDKNGSAYKSHPISGKTIAGFQVPFYPEIIAMLEDAASRVPEVPYVGWDIAITENGPLIIEGNHNSSVFQAKPSISGSKIGLLPHYEHEISG